MNHMNINDMQKVVEQDRAHVWHHLTQHHAFEHGVDPRIIVEGKGLRVWDQHGREHIDGVSGGVWTVNIGYGRESMADVVRDQLVKMNFFAGSAGSVPAAQFSERLIEKMPGMKRVFFSNSGSEANEKGFKMVRQIAHKYHGGKKSKILYRERDYHGTTIGCLSAGGQYERKAHYGPYVPDFIEVPHCLEYRDQYDGDYGKAANYGERAAEAIEEVILREGPDTIGAICLEPITAGGGVIVPPDGYWEKVQELCEKYNILLHLDEVVCGLGRTGTWFGYQHYGIRPDIVTMAKGVASGYAAISCTVTTEAVYDKFKDVDDPLGYLRDISTFGGCTAGPAAALENMRIIEDEELLDNTIKMGDYFLDQLFALQERHPHIIGQVRGKGLFLGAELVKDRETKAPLEEKKVQAIIADCIKKDAVIIGATNRSLHNLNNTLCFSPSLIATKDDIDAIVTSVDGALSRLE